MRTLASFLAATIANLGLMGQLAHAGEPGAITPAVTFASGESGPAFKAMVNAAGPGYLAGGYGVTYIGRHGYFGGAGYGGRLTNGGAGFGGLLAGGRGDLGGGFAWRAEVLLGGGGGSAGSGGFVFAEPTVGLAYALGEHLNVRLYGGYFLASENQMMGPTAGAALSWVWRHARSD